MCTVHTNMSAAVERTQQKCCLYLYLVIVIFSLSQISLKMFMYILLWYLDSGWYLKKKKEYHNYKINEQHFCVCKCTRWFACAMCPVGWTNGSNKSHQHQDRIYEKQRKKQIRRARTAVRWVNWDELDLWLNWVSFRATFQLDLCFCSTTYQQTHTNNIQLFCAHHKNAHTIKL